MTEQEANEYVETVTHALAAVPKPWDKDKRKTYRGEVCLVSYMGIWPNGQWPDAVELGTFLGEYIAHKLAAQDCNCGACQDWYKPECELPRLWNRIRYSVTAEADYNEIRLVDRTPWEVTVDWAPFEPVDAIENEALGRSYPRLEVYGRYGIELRNKEEMGTQDGRGG